MATQADLLTGTRRYRGSKPGRLMTKGESMKPAPKKSEETVTWRVFQGTLANIEQQVLTADIPKNWGAAELVKQFIINHVPSGPGWKGNIRVTSYRTPPNDNGTGTAFLSVHWEPQKGRDA